METRKYRIIQTDLKREISHGICVSNLACQIGRRMELSEATCHDLAVAGLLHDIGKLEMAKILYARDYDSTLHVEELRYVRTHPVLGYAILGEQGYSEEIAGWVLYHHENYDGSGYPANRSGEDIPLGARILRVCDAFSALIADRSYRRAFDVETAVELMIEEVKNFDMNVFLAFLTVIHSEEMKEFLKQQAPGQIPAPEKTEEQA